MEWLKKFLLYIDPFLSLVLNIVIVVGSSAAMIYMFAIGAFEWEFFLTFAITLFIGVRDVVNRFLKSES